MESKIELYLGDCLEVTSTLTDIDVIITDPPYGVNNNNDYRRFTKGPNSHGIPKSRTYPPTIGDDFPFDPSPWLNYKKVIMWGYNNYANKLPVGTTLVWIKRNTKAFGTFLSDAEIAWMKGGKGVFCYKDLSMYSLAAKRTHPNQKPVGLIKWCLEKAKIPKGTTILDPYMGVGTTAIACIQTGYNFIGIEINPKYFKIAEKRIKEAQLQMRFDL